MSRLRMAACAACCIFALSSVQAAASEAGQCWQSYEVEAAKVRDLHIMLMLGALRCRAAHKGIADKYEAFTKKQDRLLSSYARGYKESTNSEARPMSPPPSSTPQNLE